MRTVKKERVKLPKLLLIVVVLLSISQFTKGTTIYSTGNAGSWSNVSAWSTNTVPGPGDDVVIENGNNITMDIDATVNSLTIDATVDPIILTINAGITLTTTSDVTLTSNTEQARITLKGNMTVGGNINLNSPSDPLQAQINIRTGAVIQIAGGIVLTDYGKIYSSAGEAYTIRYNGTSAQTVLSNSNIIYYNLAIANSNTSGATLGGTLTSSNLLGNLTVESGIFDNGGRSISGVTGKTFTVNNGATFQLSDHSGMPTTLTHSISSGAIIKYVGSDQTITAPNNSQHYYDLWIDGTGTKSLSSDVVVDHDLKLVASTLDATASNYNITVGGNWQNVAGTFTAQSGTVTLNGSAAQTVTSNANDFYNLTFNNSSSAGITLSDDATVTNVATFTDGVVTTGSNALILTSNATGAATGYSNTSFVYGYLRRTILGTDGTFDFPVGNGTGTSNYFLASIATSSLATTNDITGSFGPLTNSNNADLNANEATFSYESLAPTGTWHLVADAQPTGGSYDVKLFLTNITDRLTDNQFGILKRHDGSTSAADWNTGGGSISPDDGAGRLKSDGYALRMGLTSFSEFGIGRSTSGGWGLPVSLTSFAANLNNNGQVDLNWTTATETNNDFFTVERSDNATDFSLLFTQKGAGNSTSPLAYAGVDKHPLSGTSYYRLKQTDFDGKFKYVGLVAINNNGSANNVTPAVTVYPNPASASQTLSLQLNNVDVQSGTSAQLYIYSLSTGQQIVSQVLNGNNGKVILPTTMAPGIYLARVLYNGDEFKQQVVVQ